MPRKEIWNGKVLGTSGSRAAKVSDKVPEVKAISESGENISTNLTNIEHTLDEHTKELQLIQRTEELILGQEVEPIDK